MKEKNYYLARMTIYNYNKNKVKFDYSLIKVDLTEKKEKEVIFKSTSSSEMISVHTDYLKPQFYSCKEFTRVLKVFEYNKENGGFLENEKAMNRTMKENFFKHYWYKFKFKKLINKKIRLGQFAI